MKMRKDPLLGGGSNAKKSDREGFTRLDCMNSSELFDLKGERAWTAAISNAESVAGYSTNLLSIKQLMGEEFSSLAKYAKKLMNSGHPILDTMSDYISHNHGWHFRGLVVLIMARAISPINASNNLRSNNGDVGNNRNKETEATTDSNLQFAGSVSSTDIAPSQLALSEIAEMIHSASLIHDDVVNVSPIVGQIDDEKVRRVVEKGHMADSPTTTSPDILFGNKVAVLGGDFLLAKACVALACLKNTKVVEMMSSAVADVVEGESMRLNSDDYSLESYLRMVQLKTGSLLGNSCASVASLSSGSIDPAVVEVSGRFGRAMGMAYQIVEDAVHANHGLVAHVGERSKTAINVPTIFALGQGTSVEAVQEGVADLERLERDVLAPNSEYGMRKTKELVEGYCEEAILCLEIFPESEAKSALVAMAKALPGRLTGPSSSSSASVAV
eukprot:Nk52_evm22s266 gene=Nk52_evmTU22s266